MASNAANNIRKGSDSTQYEIQMGGIEEKKWASRE